MEPEEQLDDVVGLPEFPYHAITVSWNSFSGEVVLDISGLSLLESFTLLRKAYQRIEQLVDYPVVVADGEEITSVYDFDFEDFEEGEGV